MAGLVGAAVSAIGGIAGAASGGGGGGSSGGGGFFSPTTPPSVPTSYSQSTTLPDWYTSAEQGVVGRAGDAASTAEDIAQQGSQGYLPYFNTATSALGTLAGGTLDQNAFDSYMNPYTEDVANQIATLGNRNLTENVLPAVNDTFTGAGQFGGNRNAEFESRALRDNQQAISNAQAGALSSGFNTALQGYETGQNQQLGIANAYANLGTGITNNQGAAIKNLLAPSASEAAVLGSLKLPTSISGTQNAPLPGAQYGPSPAAGLASAAQAIPGLIDKLSGPDTASDTNPSTGNSYASDLAGGVIPMAKGGPAKPMPTITAGALKHMVAQRRGALQHARRTA